MKKFVCIFLAALMIAATCMILAGCGEDKKDAKKATVAPTVAPTQAPTVVPTAAATLAPITELSTDAPQEEQPQETQNPDLYGGITSAEAVEQALYYVGEGYEVVSNVQSYMYEQEAWYVGVKAFTQDSTVYYMYINSSGIYPQTEIPDRTSPQSGLWGDITLDQAVSMVRSYLGEGWTVTGSTQSYYGDDEAWNITAETEDSTYILYVNANGVLTADEY